MKIGTNVKQTYSGKTGIIVDLQTNPDGTECAWVLFDRRRTPVLRILSVLEVAA